MDGFNQVQDHVEALEAQEVLRHVGIWTADGVRDYILYAREREQAATALRERLEEFGAQIEFQMDSGWTQFKDLKDMAGR